MQKKISLSIYFLFSFIYFNQGIWGLKSASLYYLMREDWKLSVANIALIGCITTLPWTIKPLWGIIVDSFPLGKKKTKYWLILNYSIISILSLIIWRTGLNYWSLILTGFLFGCAFAFSDVAGDGFVCVLALYNLDTLSRFMSRYLPFLLKCINRGWPYNCIRWGVDSKTL